MSVPQLMEDFWSDLPVPCAVPPSSGRSPRFLHWAAHLQSYASGASSRAIRWQLQSGNFLRFAWLLGYPLSFRPRSCAVPVPACTSISDITRRES